MQQGIGFTPVSFSHNKILVVLAFARTWGFFLSVPFLGYITITKLFDYFAAPIGRGEFI